MTAAASSLRLILSMDPGKISGLGRLDLATGDAEFIELDFDDTIKWLWVQLATAAPGTVDLTTERFTVNANTHKKTAATWSLELIGAMKAIGLMYSAPPVVLQNVSDAKAFSTDAKLRSAGWFQSTKGNHANDAARHMMMYCMGRGLYFTKDDMTRMAQL